MRALAFGVLAALVLAGPKLYALVSDGSMTGETALLRGGVVAVACAVGFAVISSIGSAYCEQARKADEDHENDEKAATPAH